MADDRCLERQFFSKSLQPHHHKVLRLKMPQSFTNGRLKEEPWWRLIFLVRKCLINPKHYFQNIFHLYPLLNPFYPLLSDSMVILHASTKVLLWLPRRIKNCYPDSRLKSTLLGQFSKAIVRLYVFDNAMESYSTPVCTGQITGTCSETPQKGWMVILFFFKLRQERQLLTVPDV